MRDSITTYVRKKRVKRIVIELKRKFIKQAIFVKPTKCSKSYISMVLNGKEIPTETTLRIMEKIIFKK